MLLEDSKALLTEDDSGLEQLTFLAAVPTVMSLARVPSAVRHVDVAGEALTQAVMENLGCRIPSTTPATVSHPLPRPCAIAHVEDSLVCAELLSFVCCTARL